MRHTLPIAPQFYVTAPQPCPYLEGRMERKLFTALQGETATKLNNSLPLKLNIALGSNYDLEKQKKITLLFIF